MKNLFLLFSLLLFSTPHQKIFAQENCPTMAGFTEMQKKIIDTLPEKSIGILNNYMAEIDLITTCQIDKIEALYEQFEKANFSLEDVQKKFSFPPQIIVRCNQFNQMNAECILPNADDSMRYSLTENPRYLTVPQEEMNWQFSTKLSGYQLIAAYQISMQQTALRPKKLPSKMKSSTLWHTAGKKQVLMAIYQTSGPWRYRKIVWYFD